MSGSSTPDLDHVDNIAHGPVRPAKSDGPDSERSVNAIPVMDPSHPDYPPLRHTPDYPPQPHASFVSADTDKFVLREAHSSVTAPAGQLHGDTAPQTADYKILRKNPPKEAENFENAEEFDDSDDSDDSDDPCKLYKSLPAGFPRLAEFMASNPERALFRTFKTIGVQNLHYMQAELDYLEWKLGLSMEKEQASGLTAKLATDWGFSIMKSPAYASEQYHIIMEIRQKLEKYGTVEP